jgi:hypothetical protein
MCVMLVEPLVQIEAVILFGLKHTGKSLPVNTALIFIESLRRDLVVKLVGIGYTPGEYLIEPVEGLRGRAGAQPQAKALGAAGRGNSKR